MTVFYPIGQKWTSVNELVNGQEWAWRDHGDTSNSHFQLFSEVFTYTLYCLIHKESSVSIKWNEVGESHSEVS